VTATNITTDWLQSVQENMNTICTKLQHENSDHFLIWHKEELVCTGISGSLGREKGRRLRWAGYLTGIDITNKELCDYTGHLVLGGLRN
jgi:hypothetical protein